MLGDRQKTFTENVGRLILYAINRKFKLSFGEVARPIEMQKIYFESGRSKTMDSRHLQKLAVDFAIFENDKMLFAPGISEQQYIVDLEKARILGSYWESLHPDNIWGGDWNRNGVYDETFKDAYHFEMKP